jgi:hypothetical protein
LFQTNVNNLDSLTQHSGQTMQSESFRDEIELKRESDSKLKVSTDEMKNDPFRFADDSDVETESETRLVFRFHLFFKLLYIKWECLFFNIPN